MLSGSPRNTIAESGASLKFMTIIQVFTIVVAAVAFAAAAVIVTPNRSVSPEVSQDGGRGEEPLSDTPEFVASPTPILSPIPSMVEESPSSVTPLPPSPVVQPIASPRMTPPVQPPYSISFVNLPQSVTAGTPFTVSWRVEGPRGTIADQTAVNVSYRVQRVGEGGGLSSVSSETSQSFGQFAIPRTFSMGLQYGSEPGDIHLRVTTTVVGKTISAQQTVRVK